jgi:hypothetical protein
MTEVGEEADVLDGGRKQSRRERFRERILKKGDRGEKPKAKEFELDEDVNDFLLRSPPEGQTLSATASIPRKPVPRIDVSSSPRWPDAHELPAQDVRAQPVHAEEDAAPSRPRKPRRREGLTVSFAQTAPQVIGEGGDEAEDPTITISRARRLTTGPATRHDGRNQELSASFRNMAQPIPRRDVPDNSAEEDFTPRILVRAPTGLAEVKSMQAELPAAKGMQDADIELSMTPEKASQFGVQPGSRLSPSSVAGLRRRMREEEAIALSSGLRDPSPEPSSQQESFHLHQGSPDNQSPSFTPPHVRRTSSPNAFPSPPSSLVPHLPPRPSSSSSQDSTGANSFSERDRRRPSNEYRRRLSPAMAEAQSRPAQGPSISKEEVLTEFRNHSRTYYPLFVLAAEKTDPGLNAALSQWMRAGAWWFLKAEAGFKVLRSQLGSGTNLGQIVTSRQHVQAVVDLSKTAWIVEDIVLKYAEAETIDLSTAESVNAIIETDPLSRLSRTLQYWQDLSQMYGSLVAATRRNGFMTSGSEDMPLSPGIDTSIWVKHDEPDPQISRWLRTAVPSWVKMDVSAEPIEPFDLSKTLPLKSTANTFRMKSVFCLVSGSFGNEQQCAAIPCVLTIARRRGSYALVFFIASQDHSVNVVVETNPVRADGIVWQQANATVLFHFADTFQFLVHLQPTDYAQLKGNYDLAMRASAWTRLESLGNARETLIFRVSCQAAERKSTKAASFPPGEQRDCKVLLSEEFELVGDGRASRRSHRGFRLSIILSPHASNLAILDLHLGGDMPILIHNPSDRPACVEIMDVNRTTYTLQFSHMRDLDRFFECLTSTRGSTTEDSISGKVSLSSFSTEPSSMEAGGLLRRSTWSTVQVTSERVRSNRPNRTTGFESVNSIKIRVDSNHGIIADRLIQGMYPTTFIAHPYSLYSKADPRSVWPLVSLIKHHSPCGEPPTRTLASSSSLDQQPRRHQPLPISS